MKEFIVIIHHPALLNQLQWRTDMHVENMSDNLDRLKIFTLAHLDELEKEFPGLSVTIYERVETIKRGDESIAADPPPSFGRHT